MTRELGSGETRLLVDSAGKSGPSQVTPERGGKGDIFLLFIGGTEKWKRMGKREKGQKENGGKHWKGKWKRLAKLQYCSVLREPA
jgi:hypothetical protein